MDFVKPNDGIHMLSWDDGEPIPTMFNDNFAKVDGVTVSSLTFALFNLILKVMPFQLTPTLPLTLACHDVPNLFILRPDINEMDAQDV